MSPTSKASVKFIEIGSEQAGQRLDNFLLRELKGVPKSRVYKMIRGGEVRVNKGRVDQTYRLEAGDVLRVPPVRVADGPDVAPAVAASERVSLTVLFEDDALLAIDKPAGLAVHGGSGVSFGVIELLRAQRPEAKFLELVHRLDRETSGILLVAKKRSALVKLHDMLRDNHRIDKRYLAMVNGVWPDDKRHLRYKLFKYTTADGERRVRVTADGQESHTVFIAARSVPNIHWWNANSRLAARIRFACIWPPLASRFWAMKKYGDFTLNKQLPKAGLRRMFLHAWRLTLDHPISGEPLALHAPLPQELGAFVDAHTAPGRVPLEK